MLKLKNITKDYIMSDEVVHALKGVSLNLRESEFVAILGPSGCGKTTLLNIIGGLDRYTSGDLIINGKSTKNFKDGDWDTYRNHSIGFVFQSYNLISHINVLANVELALTIAGVSKTERRKRAYEALKAVGLADKAKKKPNQLSGGQMQRVAIARALINNPDIVLADEPTGALDSETSIQIMELLKEVSKERLVIMVTHNPELANEYATRIVTMKDGLLESDSNPFVGIDETNEHYEKAKKKSQMSFKTALGLSTRNLISKKWRTFLVSFAGSIGIIGIALILSLSSGFNDYINDVQANAMSTYPITVRQKATPDLTSLIGGDGSGNNGVAYPNSDVISENSLFSDLLTTFSKTTTNNTKKFKQFLESDEIQNKYKQYINGIQYTYSQPLNIYSYTDLNHEVRDEFTLLNPIESPSSFLNSSSTYRTKDGTKLPTYLDTIYKTQIYSQASSVLTSYYSMMGIEAFGELLDNQALLEAQFDVLEGKMPQAKDEIVLKVDKFNRISDIYLYALGLKDISYLISNMAYEQTIQAGVKILPEPAEDQNVSFTFKDVIGLEYALNVKSEYFVKVNDDSTLGYHYENKENDKDYINEVINNTLKLKVVGIVRAKEGVSSTSLSGVIGYSDELYSYIVNQTINPTESPFSKYKVLKDQMANPAIDVLTGEPFGTNNSYNLNLTAFGYVDESTPENIYIYPSSFEGKEKIFELIEEYNTKHVSNKEDQITVSDTVGTMIDSVQIIVDSVSYVLIAFVSISLVVSSIMIGIITYVSVLERTKEIGVLRSLGARKKDISRVFNAETLIIGLGAGLLGVGVSLFLDIPIMLIINSLTQIGLVVTVPWFGILLLPTISVLLTMVAGLLPASIAAKKDPVVALRSE